MEKFRRDVLNGSAAGLAGLSTMMTGTAAADRTSPSGAAVRFDDQRIDGDTITLSTLRTRRASVLFVVSDSFEVLARKILPGRSRRTECEISLTEPITATQELNAILFEWAGQLAAGDSARVTIGEAATSITFADQSGDGGSVEIAHLRTDVDASLFVFDGAGEEIGGEGVRFVGGTELESLTVPLADPLYASQTVRVVLYESNSGPIAEAEAFVEVADAGPATLIVDDQQTDGTTIDVSYLRTAVDSSLFIVDEGGDTIGGSGVTFDAGEEVTSLTVDLDEPLESTQELTATLYESNGGPIAEAAFVADVSEGDVASISVPDQESDGSEIEIASLRTDVEAALFVFDETDEVVGDASGFEPGDDLESIGVGLDEPLDSSQELTVTVYESNGGPIAEDTAYVTIS